MLEERRDQIPQQVVPVRSCRVLVPMPPPCRALHYAHVRLSLRNATPFILATSLQLAAGGVDFQATRRASNFSAESHSPAGEPGRQGGAGPLPPFRRATPGRDAYIAMLPTALKTIPRALRSAPRTASMVSVPHVAAARMPVAVPSLARHYASGGGLSTDEIRSRIDEVIKSFEKVDPSKVRGVRGPDDGMLTASR